MDSIKGVSSININQIIIYIMAVFAMIGAADRIVGNRFGIGQKFEEGIQAMGILTLSMAGLLVLTPVLSRVFKPVVVPLFTAIGADPAMFAGILFGIDMGAAPLAEELAETVQAAQLGGIIAASMLGATIVFTIPVGLGLIEEADRKALAKGVLLGFITIPLGVIAGGLAAGFPLVMVLKNTVPIAVISLLIALGMWKWEKAMIAGFVWFGKFIVAVSIFGLAAGILSELTGVSIFREMTSLKEVFLIVGNIAIMLAGAFPLVHIVTKLLKRPLLRGGKKLGINETAAAGFLVSLPNSIPMFGMLKDMDPKGKVMNVAFTVSGAFVLGDHLGFVAGYCPDMIMPLLVGKLTAGVTAVALAYAVVGREKL